jgi:putative ABC transport system ATP-binding protein
VEILDLKFAYPSGREILDIESLEIPSGETVFLYGPSGSGKTTLLGLLAGVLEARGGSVRVLGRELAGMSRAERDGFRGAHLGYIFQLFNLIPYLNVLDNITLPCQLNGERRAKLGNVAVDEAARRLAEQLNISRLLSEKVVDLSVGQQQRVAAARALIGKPELVIADEPTSSLDAERQAAFLDLLRKECAEAGAALLFVSHDLRLAGRFDRTLALGVRDGRASLEAAS